jgi:hypothetical protein
MDRIYPDPDSTVTLPAMRLTLRELEDFLHHLQLARRMMDPKVSELTPNPPNEFRDVESSPDFAVMTASGEEHRGPQYKGSVLVALQHRGFGWLGFELFQKDAVRLRDALLEVTRPGPSATAVGGRTTH